MESTFDLQNTSEKYVLIQGDCLSEMRKIPDKSIDLILCDLPYGTTQNKWDKPLPLEDYIEYESSYLTKTEYLFYAYRKGLPYAEAQNIWNKHKRSGLWSQYKRIIKDRGCIALFCQTPFDVKLGQSNPRMLKYEWIIEKTKATNFLNSKKSPLKAHEKILIFYKKAPTYNPQMTSGHPPVHTYTKHTSDGNCYGKTKPISGGGSTLRYPRDVLKFKWDTQKSTLHETQKPEELLKYFVKTYTKVGDIVLDNCMGSGTTGVAALSTGRKFIGIEIDRDIFKVAQTRIEKQFKTEGRKTSE